MTTQEQQELLVCISGGVLRATINRPHARNALSSGIFERLLELVALMREDRSIRVMLIDATGDSFIAGGDVKAFARGLEMTSEGRSDDMRERAARAGRLCRAIVEVPQPVVVAARGFVVGAGMSILCAADLAIVSETARLMLSHVALGMSPDGGATWTLAHQAGIKRAKQLAMLGDRITAQEAHAMGLVNWVVADDELDEAADALVKRIVAGAGTAQMEVKGLVNGSAGRSFAAQVDAEVHALARCAATDDFAEGLRAVVGKRAARFGAGA